MVTYAGTQMARQANANVNKNVFGDIIYNVKAYGARCDGETDDYAVIMRLHDTIPEGSVICIPGPTLIKRPIVWTRKINIQCVGDTGYIIPDVGVTNDAITVIAQSGLDLNSIDWNINIYGKANCCRNALVLDCVNLSTINAKIKAGAADYGLVVKGCLLSEFYVHMSNNYDAPLSSAVIPSNFIFMGTGTAVTTENNASKFTLKIEGGTGNGVVKTNTSTVAEVEITGTIEGIGGAALNIAYSKLLSINNLYMEENGQDSIISNSQLTYVQSVRNDTDKLKFENCTAVRVDSYSGAIEFDSTCTGRVSGIGFNTNDTIINNSSAVSVDGPVADLTSAIQYGIKDIGQDVVYNFFHNPYMDIWTNGGSSAPDGWKGNNLTWSKETTTVYPRNSKKVSAYVEVSGTSITDGPTADILTENKSMSVDRWVSFALPIYVPTGQTNIRVYVLTAPDGAFNRIVPDITERETWVFYTGAIFVPAGKTLEIAPRVYNGTNFVAGNFYIGGLSVSNSFTPPNKLIDNGARSEYIVTSVSNAPAFVGQRAYLSGTGKWYMAKGVASSSDWIILN